MHVIISANAETIETISEQKCPAELRSAAVLVFPLSFFNNITQAHMGEFVPCARTSIIFVSSLYAKRTGDFRYYYVTN